MTDYLPPSVRFGEMRAIIAATAEVYEVTPADILGNSREARHAAPRLVAMRIAHDVCGLSLSETGKLFRRDHTSVMNAVRRIRAAIQSDPLMAEVINDILERSNGRIGE